MKAQRLFILIAGILPLTVFGQLVIAPGTEMNSGGTPDIVIQAIGNFSNGSAFDFATTTLTLDLKSNDQTLTGTVVAAQVNVEGGMNKFINGNLTVTRGITFTSGFLKPGASGKLLYTGSENELKGASLNSFVDGIFTVRHSGRIFFPVGDLGGTGDALYAPARLESGSASDEIGITVTKGNAALTPDASEPVALEFDNTRYWTVSATNPVAVSSRVSLSLNNIADFSSGLSPVVVESSSTGGTAVSLGSSSNDASFVTSRRPFTQAILAIGGSEEVVVKVHDIITPFTKDGFNDNLYIENIDKYSINKVSILDRWGVPVNEWRNFTNYDDPINPNSDGYDFTKLSPGSYICIVEYGDEGGGSKKISQMISVLKTN